MKNLLLFAMLAFGLTAKATDAPFPPWIEKLTNVTFDAHGAGSVGTAAITDGTITEDDIIAFGNQKNLKRVLKFKYDLTTFGVIGGGIASYSLSQGLPAKALVTKSYFYTVTKPVAVSGTPTIAFTCGGTTLKAAYAWQTEQTGSQFVAVGATTEGTANGNANTAIALASACSLYAAIGTASYSAGVIDGYLEYVITD